MFKTTLAELLLYQHLADGWEPVVIRRDVAEGARLLQPGKRQVFYFDDFMGATFLGDRGAVGMNQDDRALVDFMGLIGDTPSARLILTTREHIFGQALTASERLRDAGLDSRKLVLRVSDYSQYGLGSASSRSEPSEPGTPRFLHDQGRLVAGQAS